MLEDYSGELNALCIGMNQCDICRHLRSESEPPPNINNIAIATLSDFTDRATRSCIICTLICNTAVTRANTWRHLTLDKVLITVRTRGARTDCSKELMVIGYEILRHCPPDEADWVRNAQRLFTASLYSPLESPSPIKWIPSLPHIDPDPLSRATWETVHRWLESCSKHEDCSSDGIKIFPKRLIDVGSPDDPTIRLTLATEDHTYLALSYCWGSRQPLSTTKANEASMRLEIPWKLLPRSFQHAIEVTKRLGKRYIWIDSLCIIQDDERDWEEEAAKMAGIYSRCDLVIAASRAFNCDEGFLQVRNEGKLVMSRQYEVKQLVVFSRDVNEHASSVGAVPYFLHELPLFRRGWCFQERLMAPRALHFTPNELFFQCRTEDWCECGGGSAWRPTRNGCFAVYAATVPRTARQICAIEKQKKQVDMRSEIDNEDGSISPEESRTTARSLGSNAVALVRRLYSSHVNVTADSEEPISFGQMWGDIVSDYNTLSLTFQRDNLPALSGIANLMLAYKPGRYFAGLWERDIQYTLGWSSVLSVSDGRCFRSKENTVPSFSWASRIGPVAFPFECVMTSACTVLDINCDVKGADPYGQVHGGFILLQGKLIPGTIKIDWRGFIGVAVWDVQGQEHTTVLEFDTEEDEEELCQGGTVEEVYCFDLFRERDWPGGDEGEEVIHYVRALVLRRHGDEPYTFKRAGTATGLPPSAFDVVPDSRITII